MPTANDPDPTRTLRRLSTALGTALVALSALAMADRLPAGLRLALLLPLLATAVLLLALLRGWALGRLAMAAARGRGQAEAFARLAVSEEKARTLVERAAEGLGLLDAQNRMQVVNRRWELIFGRDRQELVGQPVQAFLSPQDQDYLEMRMRKTRAGEAQPPAQWELRRPDGTQVSIETLPERVEFDGETFAIVALHDVTERNRLRRQTSLNEKLATVGTLAAGVVHEINNPATSVLGLLDMMTDLLDGPRDEALLEQVVVLAGRAREQTRHLCEIVGSLKGFARMDAEDFVPADVNAVLDAALVMVHHETRHKARIEKDYASLPGIMGHPGRLQQLFVNLLVNAAQAMDEAPARNRITVRTRLEEDYVRVEVEDTGSGIPDAVLGNIFDPFFTTKAPGVGTGLGLPICHEIVRQHGGEIGVESREGEGTRFFLTLSRLMAPVPALLAPIPLRALLVDDDPLVLTALKRLLRKRFQVLTAEGGRQAMALLASEPVDAVVTDLNMPDVNGLDLYRHIALHHPALKGHVVFCTGGNLSADIKAFLAGENLTCLEKPFSLEDLERSLLPRP
jgi:PAS domain S-box-containing protein